MPINLNSFVQAAQQANADTTLKISGDGVRQTGSVGSFFTLASTHRESMAGFIGALRSQYGDSIANVASSMLQGSMTAGKPLKAYMVTDLLKLAQSEQTRYQVDAFIRGADPGHNLDSALDGLCARHAREGISPENREILKQQAAGILRGHAFDQTVSPESLTRDISEGSWGISEIAGILRSRNPQYANQPGTTEDKIQLCRLLGCCPDAINLALRQLTAMRAVQPQRPLSPQTVWRAVFDEPLPEALAANPAGLGQAAREKINAATAARIGRARDAHNDAQDLLTPERLLADIHGKAQTRSPGVTIQPQALADLASRVDRKIMAAASDSDNNLSMEQIQGARDAEINAFFRRLDEAAAQVPENRRPAFVRACLESGLAPKPEVARNAAQLSGDSMGMVREIFKADSGANVRQTLDDLNRLTGDAWGELRGQTRHLPPEQQLDADDQGNLIHLALLMNLDEIMGAANPESLALGLARPGGPFRDALYDCRRVSSQLIMAYRLQSALISRLPETGAKRLEQALNHGNIRERDLSLARQREIFGPGVFEVRGASLTESVRQMGFTEALVPSLTQARSAIEARMMTNAGKDLREGIPEDKAPGRLTTPEQLAARAAHLSTGFILDFPRGGVYVDGRYHHPASPPAGTNTSMMDFIALFPNPRAAGFISNLLSQSLPGLTLDAQMFATTGAAQAFFQVTQTDPVFTDGRVKIIQDFRVDTLDAAAGRYRLSAQFHKIAAEDEAEVDRFMSETTLEVTLSDPPTVDSARIDFLLRGREPGPGETA